MIFVFGTLVITVVEITMKNDLTRLYLNLIIKLI